MNQTTRKTYLLNFPNAYQTGKRALLKLIRFCFESMGYILTRKRDYYGPTPSEFELSKTRSRWMKPSGLHGVYYDLDTMESSLAALCSEYMQDFLQLPPYKEMVRSGFGPGYPYVDAFVLYSMLRTIKPRHYLEVGSGLSTAYARSALTCNAANGNKFSITCIEPFPYNNLRSLADVQLIQSPVQDVSLGEFAKLGADDILFIDSSHILRIDGDVPFLFLEVLPTLCPGVIIHIHDIPFPFNIPYPAEFWTLLEHQRSHNWPMYWNEAMLVQAMLTGNSAFEILQSLPLLRFFRESRLRSLIPFSKSISEEPNTFSSLWLRKK